MEDLAPTPPAGENEQNPGENTPKAPQVSPTPTPSEPTSTITPGPTTPIGAPQAPTESPQGEEKPPQKSKKLMWIIGAAVVILGVIAYILAGSGLFKGQLIVSTDTEIFGETPSGQNYADKLRDNDKWIQRLIAKGVEINPSTPIFLTPGGSKTDRVKISIDPASGLTEINIAVNDDFATLSIIDDPARAKLPECATLSDPRGGGLGTNVFRATDLTTAIIDVREAISGSSSTPQRLTVCQIATIQPKQVGEDVVAIQTSDDTILVLDIMARPQCGDAIDNDGDGNIDLADASCSNANDNDESDDPPPTTECADGIDNDGDNLTDYPDDPSCADANDDDEANPPQCSDGIDNDGDGFVDFAGNDPGCTDTADDDEVFVPECNDGIDNDGDNFMDYPDDPDCISINDNEELGASPPPDQLTATLTDDDSDGDVEVGDTITYTLTLSNSTNSPIFVSVNNTGLVDANTENLTLIDDTHCGDPSISFDPITNEFTTGVEVDALGGSDCTITYQADVKSTAAAGDTIEGHIKGGNSTINIDLTSTPLAVVEAGSVNLLTTLLEDDDDGDGLVARGDTVQYIFTITNNTSASIPGISVNNNSVLDSNTENLREIAHSDCGSSVNDQSDPASDILRLDDLEIAAGGPNCVISYKVDLKANATIGDTIQSNIRGGGLGATVNFNVDSNTLWISDGTNLSASTIVTDDNDATVDPGQTVAYTLTLTNTGSTPVTNYEILSDDDINLENLQNLIITNCGSTVLDSSNSAQKTNGVLSLNAIDVAVAVGAGSECVITYDLDVKSDAPAATVITHNITVGEVASSTPRTIISSLTVAGGAQLPACSDGADNDADGLTDYPADPGCSSDTDNDETDTQVQKAQCEDGIDNDGDGDIDLVDAGCNNASDNDESDDPVLPECSDGIDNEGDGTTDYPDDPGCKSATDPSEFPECSDSIDNDNDGYTDGAEDPGCTNADDDDESNDPAYRQFPKCSDGKDNDGDGLIDLADPGCLNRPDNDDETDPQEEILGADDDDDSTAEEIAADIALGAECLETIDGVTFGDIKNKHYADDEIHSLANIACDNVAITIGYGVNGAGRLFNPTSEITRAELIKMATTASGSYTEMIKNTKSCGFTDLDKDHWAVDIMNGACNAGYIGGFEDGTIRPDSSITRAEVITILLKISGDEIQEYEDEDNPFLDVSVDDWYYNEAIQAFYSGISKGKAITIRGQTKYLFLGNRIVTREDMAVMLFNRYKTTSE